MFSTEHFIWIAVCLVWIAVLTVISVRCKFSFRTSALIMAGISVVSELSKIFSHMDPVSKQNPDQGMVIDPTALPLHLCSLLIFVFLYLPFAKDEKRKQYFLSLLTPVGLIGSLFAILLATSGTDFTTVFAYQCFLYHASMIWFALYLILTKQVNLGFKAWLTNAVSLFGMSILMIWINGILKTYKTNFWYVVKPPVKGLPLLNLDNGWFVYYITLVVVACILLTAIHLPFILAETAKKKSSKHK